MYNFGEGTCLDCKLSFKKTGSYHFRCSLCSIPHNRKKQTAKKLKYYHEDKEKHREWQRISRGNNIEAYIIRRSRASARKYSLDFSITKEDIIIPEFCPYLGIKLTPKEFKVDSCPSIDRIDSTKGYIKGNIQIISFLANRMKSNATMEQLVTFARGVLFLHSNDFGLLQM